MDEVLKQAASRVGSVLKGKWRLDELLGCGGMAVVYRATHRNGNEVAVKMLHPHLSMNKDVRERFLREGYVANKVRHRGAVIVQDDDVSDEGAAFLVMEMLHGQTLEARRVRLGGRLTAVEVLQHAEQLLEVLVKAHEHGIVHRDLKPENLILTEDGVLKVLDFGIARLRELSGASSATQTGSLLGTPAYMAPEQARGRWKDVDHATDLWAVGATMFTLLSGHAVHEAETASETLALAVTQPARPLASVAPHVSRGVAAIVDRALRYDKHERFISAESMLAAVRAVIADDTSFAEDETEVSNPAQPFGPLPPLPPPPVRVAAPQPVAQAATAAPVSLPMPEPARPVPPIVGGETTMTPGAMELTTTARKEPKRLSLLRHVNLAPKQLLIALIAAVTFMLGSLILIGTLIATRGSDAVDADVIATSSGTAATAPEHAVSAPPPEVAPSLSASPEPSASAQTAPPKLPDKPQPKPVQSATKPVVKKPPVKPPVTKPPPPGPDPWDIRGK